MILDEATSALDNQTEQAVIEAVNKLSKDITIIMIAHRFNTVKNCDVIFQFEKGELIKQGSFDEVINDNKSFFLKIMNDNLYIVEGENFIFKNEFPKIQK